MSKQHWNYKDCRVDKWGSYETEPSKSVLLPHGESLPKWVAANIVDCYNEVFTIWIVIEDYIDVYGYRDGEGFPPGVEYRWMISAMGHVTFISMSAPKYIETVLEWAAGKIKTEFSRIPPRYATMSKQERWYEQKVALNDDEAYLYDPAFATLCGQIFRRIFRVYAIIFSTFFKIVCQKTHMAPTVMRCFKHLMYFSFEFELLPKREMEPIMSLVSAIQKQYISDKQDNSKQGRC